MNILERMKAEVSPDTIAKNKREKKASEDYKKEEALLKQVDQSPESSSRVRFGGSNWFNIIKKRTASLIGVGGIGSYVAFGLERASIGELQVFDPDIIDNFNMAGQLYKLSDIGQHKVTAINKIISEFCPTNTLSAMAYLFDGKQPLRDITITALDNMKARKLVWEAYWKTFINKSFDSKKNGLFIDARMSAEAMTIFCFRPSQIQRVSQYINNCLFDDGVVPEQPCTYKATSHVGLVIGGMVTAMVTNHLNYQGNDNSFNKNVPFVTSIDFTDGIKITQSKSWQLPSLIKE